MPMARFVITPFACEGVDMSRIALALTGDFPFGFALALASTLIAGRKHQ